MTADWHITALPPATTSTPRATMSETTVYGYDPGSGIYAGVKATQFRRFDLEPCLVVTPDGEPLNEPPADWATIRPEQVTFTPWSNIADFGATP